MTFSSKWLENVNIRQARFTIGLTDYDTLNGEKTKRLWCPARRTMRSRKNLWNSPIVFGAIGYPKWGGYQVSGRDSSRSTFGRRRSPCVSCRSLVMPRRVCEATLSHPIFCPKLRYGGLLSLLLALVVVFQATLYNSTRTKHPVLRYHL